MNKLHIGQVRNHYRLLDMVHTVNDKLASNYIHILEDKAKLFIFQNPSLGDVRQRISQMSGLMHRLNLKSMIVSYPMPNSEDTLVIFLEKDELGVAVTKTAILMPGVPR